MFQRRRKSNTSLIQSFEPGMQFSIDDLPGKVFLCSKEREEGRTTKLQYLGITKIQIIELIDVYENKVVQVSECHQLSALSKVKFKRSEVITFQFQSGITKRYFMFDSSECVNYIKEQMSNSGISSTHTSRKHSLNVSTAQSLLSYVKELEEEFSKKPSHDLVMQMMDLLRESIECFGEANDDRYQLVVSYVQKFLIREDVLKILDQQNGTVSNSQIIQQSQEIPVQKTDMLNFDPIINTNNIHSDNNSNNHSLVSNSLSIPLDLNHHQQQQETQQRLSLSKDTSIQSKSLIRTNSNSLPIQNIISSENINQNSSPIHSQKDFNHDDIKLDDNFSENENMDDFDDEIDEFEENKYLPSYIPNYKFNLPSNLTLNFDEINQTINDIDRDEIELGQYLNDISCELDEILGVESKTSQFLSSNDHYRNSLTEFSIDLITFEEFDTFLEELTEHT